MGNDKKAMVIGVFKSSQQYLMCIRETLYWGLILISFKGIKQECYLV